MNTNSLDILVGCEYSGVVRDAFVARGHRATSVDLLPSEKPGDHIQADLLQLLDTMPDGYWDIGIFHPPCTHLAVSGARWFPAKRADGSQQAALEFVRRLFASRKKFKRGIVLENPVSIISSRFRKPDQVVQPWMFGHGQTKATCFWIEGDLPKLVPSQVVAGRAAVVHRMPPGPDRWKERSRTLPGIAAAMAMQWGGV